MVPLISLGLARAEAANDAPRHSGCPNAGTGGCPLVPIFQSILKPQSHVIKVVPPPYSLLVSDAPDASVMDIAEPSLTLLQPGRRFGFVASSTTDFVHPSTTEPNLQGLENPYITIGTKVAEQDAIDEQQAWDTITEKQVQDAITEKRAWDTIAKKQAQDAITEYLDPALHQEDDTVRAQCHLRLLASEEDSDSKGSSSNDSNDSNDSDNSNNKDPDGEADGEDDEEGENDDNVKNIQDFQRMHYLHNLQLLVHSHLNLNFSIHSSQDRLTSFCSSSRMKALRALRTSHQAYSSNSPDTLSLCWKCFLEDAKVKCCVQHALENLFPALMKSLPGSITKVLITMLVMWDRNGKQFEAEVWPEQKFNMSQLSVLKLYNDLSTWQSDLKKTAISIALLSYLLIPPLLVPAQECAAWIENVAAGLIKESLFLQFGVDEMRKTQNFAHPTLYEVAIAFFYTGPYQIIQRMPEIFCMELLLLCLALVATVFNCVPDGLVKNGHGKSYLNFSSKDYSPIYNRMLVFLKDILGDADHVFLHILEATLDCVSNRCCQDFVTLISKESKTVDSLKKTRH
ncbi:hypothetical protein EDD22DRAFT_846349 [Suillus occidentalis]|nr:hypothetical protein EDD22DRAFT_846349 [Suillus occidentalis]